MWRALAGFGVYLFLIPACLFAAAGTLAWAWGWVYVALLLAASVGTRLIVWRKNPDLLLERARFSSAEGAKTWDRLLVLVVGVLGPLVTVVVAGLDHRLGWLPTVPAPLQWLAALLVAGGYLLASWAMIANRFFSAVVRIQHDRGHQVVTSGPYALVRHPAYLGGIVSGLAGPLMLDAVWALAPAGLSLLAVLIRTAAEDRTLLGELSGYRDYASKVRYRLIPGVW